MNENKKERRPLRRGKGILTKEAGAALFQGLRNRLTLWYCGVLGAALLLFGVTLYVSAQIFLLNPVMDSAKMHANAHASQWRSADDDACSMFSPLGQYDQRPDQEPFNNELIACFDQNGELLQSNDTTQVPAIFLTDNLVQAVLQTQQPQSDTVDAGGSVGQIYRYATIVRGSGGHKLIGVILVGESIKDKVDALSLLLRLLLSVGGGALLIAGLGGLFLANRALLPARLAWTNQQRFLADAAHELRTPLTLLRADAEVLLRSRKRMEIEDAALLDDIVTETNHMSNLATSMLTLARLDSGMHHREHEVIGLAGLAQRQIRRFKALADEKEIIIEARDNGSPYVIGDPTLLEQATLALLDNAIKYNRRGGRILVQTGVEHGLAVLKVSDTGIGIPEEHLSHLGERFYRVDKARSREAGGTGLGLSITRSIAITHGGQINIASRPNQGTTVALILPLVRYNATKQFKQESGESVSREQ